MTKQEALNLITQACRSVQTNFDGHVALQNALTIIGEAIKEQTPTEKTKK
jgi:hypothetical protein